MLCACASLVMGTSLATSSARSYEALFGAGYSLCQSDGRHAVCVFWRLLDAATPICDLGNDGRVERDGWGGR